MDEPTALLKSLRFDLVPDDPALLPVRLVCGPQLILGRNKEECDLVTWFLPRNEENDRETRKLSQVHAFLQHEGSRVRIRDADSGAGTFWNQQPVPPGDGITSPVGPTGKITLGRNYGISVEWSPVAAPTCAVLQPLSSEPAFRRCLWMVAAKCALRQLDADAAEGRWLIPALEGCQWVEVRQDGLWWRQDKGAPIRMNHEARVRLANLSFRILAQS